LARSARPHPGSNASLDPCRSAFARWGFVDLNGCILAQFPDGEKETTHGAGLHATGFRPRRNRCLLSWAGLLTLGSSSPGSFPFLRTVDSTGFVPEYSGGTVPDLHRLPYCDPEGSPKTPGVYHSDSIGASFARTSRDLVRTRISRADRYCRSERIPQGARAPGLLANGEENVSS
jgi:hypothetical protein